MTGKEIEKVLLGTEVYRSYKIKKRPVKTDL